MFISTLLVARVTVHGLDLTDLVCVVLHMEAVHRQPSAAVEFAKASVSRHGIQALAAFNLPHSGEQGRMAIADCLDEHR